MRVKRFDITGFTVTYRLQLEYWHKHLLDKRNSAADEQPGVIARSIAMPLGMQEAPRAIPVFGTFLYEDLVMNIFLRPLFIFR